MTSREIREKFLSFFERHGHTRVKSSGLIPEADPTLLFANAGMNQFKRTFTGEEVRAYKRATTSQKCVRAGGKHNDLENVGFTARHHTFFEMLGNFSFGDYFKKEAIDLAWSFITKELGIPPENLWVTVYKDDDEAEKLWQSVAGVRPERIKRFGEKDNFWQMGDTGPCGPCSEIHFDQGAELSCGKPTCTVNCECDRYLEIWNLVFMQFNRDETGKMTPLPRPSIDTGMGLERITAIMQGVKSNYGTDLFVPLTDHGALLAGLKAPTAEQVTSLRVIADHARATAFLITDGVLPSNEGRGYVLRRIMRRAIRHGVKLGLKEPFLWKVVGKVTDLMGDVYPDLKQNRATLEKITRLEEERFQETLDSGLRLLGEEIGKVRKSKGKNIPGAVAFTLYDTYGFPVDLTEVIAREEHLSVDMAGYDAEMEKQRERGRASWVKGEDRFRTLRDAHGAAIARAAQVVELSDKIARGDAKAAAAASAALTEAGLKDLGDAFTSWAKADRSYALKGESAVALVWNEKATAGTTSISEGPAALVTWWSPFYAEGGGQAGDRGEIHGDNGALFVVEDTQKLGDGGPPAIHLGRVVRGAFRVGDRVRMQVDDASRASSRIHHTATHVMHAALRRRLGTHVKQAGSLVGPGRLRFDFSHYEPVGDKDLRAIETEVNDVLWKTIPVTHETMTNDAAIASGALAFFGDKYGAEVRVVTIGDYSKEFCGGTHVHNTGEIGMFRFISEEGIAAGVRRVEANVGDAALAFTHGAEDVLTRAQSALRVTRQQLLERVEKLIEENKALLKELERARGKIAAAGASDLLGAAKLIGGVKVIAEEVEVADPKTLRDFAMQLRDKLGSGVVVIGAKNDGKVTLVATVSKDLIGRYHAGNIVKEIAPIVGGGGGGKPDMAQAGGTEPEKLAEALSRVTQLISA